MKTIPEIDPQLCETVATALQLQTPAARRYLSVILHNAILFDKKQQDYGPGNIADFGEIGVLIRLNDKLNRIKNLQKTKRRKPQNESLDDSWRDIHVYAAIALMLRNNLWGV